MASVQEIVRKGMIANFNKLLGEFMRKLIATYPQDADAFKVGYGKILLAQTVGKEETIIEAVAEKLEEMGPLVDGHDDKLFNSENSAQLTVFGDVDMARNWEASPENVKKAMWGYLDTISKLARGYSDPKPFVDPSRYTKCAGSANVLDKIGREIERVRQGSRVSIATDTVIAKVAANMGIDLSCLENIDLDQLGKDMLQFLPVDHKEAGRSVTSEIIEQLRILQTQQSSKRDGEMDKPRSDSDRVQ